MFKKTIFFLLIFCLPFQFGYHFWLPQSFVSSFRIDYLSPTIYFVDLLILCYLCLNHRSLRIGPVLLFLVLFNIWVSGGNPIIFYAWLRLLEYYLFFRVLRAEKNLADKAKTPFLLSLFLILTLAALQFVTQSSLGGPFYYLGERPLSVFLPNIAKINLPWGQILRPYSTFSHPNSLAGYLLVSLVLLPLFTRSKLLKIATSVTIILTFSKAAILSLILIEVFWLNLPWSLILSLFLGLSPLLKYASSLPSWLQQSFVARHYLIPPSLKIIREHWFAGVGLRQFIPSLAQRLPGNQLSYQSLQPVHNTLLLIVAELGILPIIAICLYFLKSKITLNTKYYPLATIILITGSLDHYWWTLPQNQLIIVLAVALIINMSHTSYKTNKTHDLF